MTTAVAILAGLTALITLLMHDARAARERDMIDAMESVLCVGSTCDVEQRVPGA